ncbi:HAD-superfamily subfamily IB hydrolase, TIGR01490 [Nitrosococcus halophilus Nc 4]|uniref:HAD-superfamily subfamily IB hydrolase, TIGR01490 n=1 Tax=Nitrosococcus halophilus (strain Nc4) TaxID=472759 RepID=D5C548_NITHN|nr:HAD-IB family hydrolase [Nitrosococcus halophilus]ADE15271.1 HAD-superfamily subfamily IB hydrolase, TIGR01490 [Nitrosococcus halophilus Nc 4]
MRTEQDLPTVAAFDFDGTLTYMDSLLPFLHAVAGTRRFTRDLVVLSPTLLAYKRGRLSNDEAKQQVLAHFLGGRELVSLEQIVHHFIQQTLPYLLRRRALQRLAWHQRQNHRCILVSASLELYLKPWAENMGFMEVLGSHLELTSAGVLTGRLSGKNCYGEEKPRRLAALLGDRRCYRLYAYGDSKGDQALLDYADYAYYRQFPMESRF